MSTKFKPKKNEVTGQIEFQFAAELVSVNRAKDFKYINKDNEEKTYYLGSVNFTYPNGVEAKGVTTQIYAKSLAHGMKPGDMLLSVLSKGNDGNMYIRTSHLLASNGVDAAMFEGLNFDELVEQPDNAPAATA